MSVGRIKAGVGMAVASVALVGGGLLFGPGLVSAQTPPATPTTPQQEQPQNQQTPGTPRNNGTDPNGQKQHDDADCPNMGNDDGSGESGSGSGSSFRGRGGPAQDGGGVGYRSNGGSGRY